MNEPPQIEQDVDLYLDFPYQTMFTKTSGWFVGGQNMVYVSEANDKKECELLTERMNIAWHSRDAEVAELKGINLNRQRENDEVKMVVVELKDKLKSAQEQLGRQSKK